jgi:hypothetical protein
MTGRSEPTPPAAGSGAGHACDSGVTPCPHNCWQTDFNNAIAVNSYGNYFRKYMADGTEHTDYSFNKSYTLQLPCKSGGDAVMLVKFKVVPDSGVTADQVTTCKANLASGINTHWNGKFTLAISDPVCGNKSMPVRYRVQWVDSGEDYELHVHATYPREGLSGRVMDVSPTTDAWTFAHEFAHCVGEPDEYSYTTETETVKYIKPDGTLDTAVSAPPDGKSSTDADATIMSAVGNTTVLPRHGWNVAIEAQAILRADTGRQVTCTIR